MRIVYVSDERYPSTHTDTQQVVMTVDALSRAGAWVSLVIPAWPRSHVASTFTHEPRRTPSAAVHNAAAGIQFGDKVAKFDDEVVSDHATEIYKYYGVSSPFSVRSVRSVNPNFRAGVKPAHVVAAQVILRELNPDVVYTRNPATAVASVLRGFPALLESYRVIDRSGSFFPRIWLNISRRKNFLGVVCHSRLCAESFIRAGVPAPKVVVVHNGFDASSMLPELSRQDARSLLAWDTARFVATYAGHLNPNKGIDVLARWAASTPQIHHVWVGGGDRGSTEYAKQEKDAAGAINVELAGWVSPGKLPPYLYGSDVLLIPPTAKPLTSHGSTVLPMKTFAYMASGRAIIAPDLPDIREVLTHERNALLVAPDQPIDAQMALIRLLEEPALRDRIGSQAKKDSLSCTWTARADKILSFIEGQLGRR